MLTLDRLRDDDTATHLVFDGLDTYTTIKFCDEVVGTPDNQFRQWFYDVSEILKQCKEADPVLTLNFGSVPRIINALNASGIESAYALQPLINDE